MNAPVNPLMPAAAPPPPPETVEASPALGADLSVSFGPQAPLGVGSPDPRGLPIVEATADPLLWVVGVHGGAGASTVAALLDAAAEHPEEGGFPGVPTPVRACLEGSAGQPSGGWVQVQFQVKCYDKTYSARYAVSPPQLEWVAPNLSKTAVPPSAFPYAAVPVPSECVPVRSAFSPIDGTVTMFLSPPGSPPATNLSPFPVGSYGAVANFLIITTSIRPSKSNANKHLTLREKKPTDGDYQAHHRFPSFVRTRFATIDINVDDPAWLRWWCSTPGIPGNHQSQWSAYNKDWATYWDPKLGPPIKSYETAIAWLLQIEAKYKFTCT